MSVALLTKCVMSYCQNIFSVHFRVKAIYICMHCHVFLIDEFCSCDIINCYLPEFCSIHRRKAGTSFVEVSEGISKLLDKQVDTQIEI